MNNAEKKVRIGILTFHRSVNYGAFLQSYALSYEVKKSFPQAKVEIIDYCPEFEMKKYEVSLKKFVFGSQSIRNSFKQIIKNIAKLVLMPDVLKQNKNLNNAFAVSYEKLPLSEKQWITDDYKMMWTEIEKDYDILIVGSDAVWEYKVFPFPNAYFVDNSVNLLKMSYAACSGRMNSEEVDSSQQDALKTIWSDFDYLGIRDQATEKFISSIAPELTTHHNCDPSFLLDLNNPLFNKNDVRNLLLERGIDLNKPIIGIMGGNEMGKMLREFWGDKYQIVAVYYPNRYADVYLDKLTPFEWAVVFSFFKVTFTRYFHGTIFSLKNGTPTISIDDWDSDEKRQLSKLQDVLVRTNLTEHYFKIEDMHSSEGRRRIKKAAERFIEHPDTFEIETGLKGERENFNEFKLHLDALIDKRKED